MNRYTPPLIVWLSLIGMSCHYGQRWENSNRIVIPLKDSNGNHHSYLSSIPTTHYQKLTRYCGVHYEWEVIEIRWSGKGESGDYKWNYYIWRSR